jgi:hypothetical protein
LRDYLYIWHQPAIQRLLISGIEFRDFVPDLATTGGIVLLRHRFGNARTDPTSRLEYVLPDGLAEFVAEDLYCYGDLCWADLGPNFNLPDLSDEATAELLFFAHAARPLHTAAIPGLGNRLLCWAHDDGWYARIFYHDWSDIEPMLRRLLSAYSDDQTLDRLRDQDRAVWCHRKAIVDAEPTEDIDTILNARLHVP